MTEYAAAAKLENPKAPFGNSAVPAGGHQVGYGPGDRARLGLRTQGRKACGDCEPKAEKGVD